MTNDQDLGTYTTTFPESPVQFHDYVEAKVWAQSFTADKSFGGEACRLTEEDDVNGPAYHTERWRYV